MLATLSLFGSVQAKDLNCPYLYVSWNLENFGKSKTPEALEIMAKVLRSADIVAVQEVNAGKNFGAQTIAKLVDILNRTGVSHDYIVSDATNSSSANLSERYAFILNKSTVHFSRDDARLLNEVDAEIEREPFTLKVYLFSKNKLATPIQLFTIHTVPTKKDPKKEVVALVSVPIIAKSQNAIFSGDFNLAKAFTDDTFVSLGYVGAIDEATSLHQKLTRNNEYVFRQYDNIYTKGVTVCESGIIDFVGKYFSPVTDESLKRAREVSDHLPVYARFR